jgi:hypothetical protein
MGVHLYALRKRAVIVLAPNRIRDTIYFLQLAVECALSQDSQGMADSAVKYVHKEWEEHSQFPKFAVQVGSIGIPLPNTQFCENGFNIDHRENRKAEGAERGESQRLAERLKSVLSLLALCIHLIVLEAPQFGLLPNQASHAYILISSSSFFSFSKSN